MANKSDEILLLNKSSLQSLSARSMRDGLLGKTLEDALQTILQEYPQIIPGKQIDPTSDDPPRFFLLRREMPVGSWSLDHLYVDQKGILTLVETKLIQNPQSRREVIDQMVEYAANALEKWGNEKARRFAMEFWNSMGKDLDEELKKSFGEEIELTSFWATVEENLQNGRIRLIIATDELWPEVRRMIEYMNSEMRNAEVLGLELKCYGDDQDQLVLVPLIVGQSQINVDRRTAGEPATLWTAEKLQEFCSALEDKELCRKLKMVLDWSIENANFLMSKAKLPSFLILGKVNKTIAAIYTPGSNFGSIYMYFDQSRFGGGVVERDKLVEELKSMQLFEPYLDPYTVIDGRNLKRKLGEMTAEEIEKLLAVLVRYAYVKEP